MRQQHKQVARAAQEHHAEKLTETRGSQPYLVCHGGGTPAARAAPRRRSSESLRKRAGSMAVAGEEALRSEAGAGGRGPTRDGVELWEGRNWNLFGGFGGPRLGRACSTSSGPRKQV